MSETAELVAIVTFGVMAFILMLLMIVGFQTRVSVFTMIQIALPQGGTVFTSTLVIVVLGLCLLKTY